MRALRLAGFKAGNRSPSIARMVWDIVTSVYSSPKAYRSLRGGGVWQGVALMRAWVRLV